MTTHSHQTGLSAIALFKLGKSMLLLRLGLLKLIHADIAALLSRLIQGLHLNADPRIIHALVTNYRTEFLAITQVVGPMKYAPGELGSLMVRVIHWKAGSRIWRSSWKGLGDKLDTLANDCHPVVVENFNKGSF